MNRQIIRVLVLGLDDILASRLTQALPPDLYALTRAEESSQIVADDCNVIIAQADAALYWLGQNQDNTAPVIAVLPGSRELYGPELLRRGAADYLTVENLTSSAVQQAITCALARSAYRAEPGELEAHLHAVLDTVPDTIWVKNLDGAYMLSNAAHRRFLNVNFPNKIIGKTAFDLFPQEQAAHFTADDKTVLDGETRRVQRDEPIRGGDGIDRWVETIKAPLRDGSGKIVGLVGISRDITDRKHADEALRKSNAELARSEAAQRSTVELLKQAHEELIQAQLQLIQAEKLESVGRLAAGIAHEVKNPLAVLLMGVEYLERATASPSREIELTLKSMKQAVHRADNIIRGLLDFSSPRPLDLQARNINDILSQSLLFVRHELNRGHYDVVERLEDGLPTIQVDHDKLVQVFVNLLTNAIHAMPDGGTLTLISKCAPASDGKVNSCVVAEIEDTGTGLPDEVVQKIYDPFFTTKPPGKGTGLGLTVSKKIVEMCGGRLDIRNRDGGGVRAAVTFNHAGD